jgi:DNA mismatch repair protein MutS2
MGGRFLLTRFGILEGFPGYSKNKSIKLIKKGPSPVNERTLKILEFDKIIAKVESFAVSQYGREMIRDLKPSGALSQIREALQITTEAVYLYTKNDRIPLGGIYDIREAVKRAALGGVLSPTELLEIGSTFRASRLMKEFLAQQAEKDVLVVEWGRNLVAFPGLERELERCFGPNGEILDNASPKLRSLRSQIKTNQNRIRDKLNSIIHNSDNAKYLQDLLVTLRNERYVIPVKQEFRNLFPGIVHDHSASGATIFVEPLAVVELNNQLSLVESQEAEEVSRILAELSGKIQTIKDSLQMAVTILARLDLAFAKARYSLETAAAEPDLNTQGTVILKSARHPLITGKVVPITLELGQNFDTLVITGPNTGGKTVTLKTVGLLTLMAQAGLHIPAASGSSIALFQEILCDIGDEQSIEQSLSTFSSHLTQIVKILAAARGPESLVLLDELGAGTDPSEGAALAMSILTHLHHLGVRTVATTHYSELKAFAYNTPGIENASVEFDIETLRPTYHLMIGLPGSSQAFEIALKLGIAPRLIQSAREFISAESAKVEEVLKEIETDRRKAREDRLSGEAARLKGEELKSRYETELAKLKEQKATLLRQAKAEARELLLETRRDSENLLRRIREGPPEKVNTIVNEARKRINANLDQMAEKPVQSPPHQTVKAETLKVGDRVRALALNQIGTVLEVNSDNVTVQLGILKVNLSFNELGPVDEPKIKTPASFHKTGVSGLETATRIATEISLRGLNVDEALYQLEKYLDQAILAGIPNFRVIHGKGTGVLRQAVQKYLKDHPAVQSVAFAEQNEGGFGATIAVLKKQ